MISKLLNFFGFVPLFLPLNKNFIIKSIKKENDLLFFELGHKVYNKLSGKLIPDKRYWKATYTNGKCAFPVGEIKVFENKLEIINGRNSWFINVADKDLFTKEILDSISAIGVTVNK